MVSYRRVPHWSLISSFFLLIGMSINASTFSLEKQLIDFSGKIREDGVIELHWKTVNEKNVLQFEIEFSTDDKRYEKFTTISSLNSEKGNSYKAYHAIACNGKIAYRIKIIDSHGDSLYSDIVRLEIKDPTENQ